MTAHCRARDRGRPALGQIEPRFGSERTGWAHGILPGSPPPLASGAKIPWRSREDVEGVSVRPACAGTTAEAPSTQPTGAFACSTSSTGLIQR